jgi:hypothetical protein
LNSNYYEIESPRYQLLTDSVLTCLTECNLPLSLVDNPVFIKMLNKFDNRYKLPGRKTLTDKYLHDKFKNRKESIQKDFEKEPKYISLTIDCWPSIANNPY